MISTVNLKSAPKMPSKRYEGDQPPYIVQQKNTTSTGSVVLEFDEPVEPGHTMFVIFRFNTTGTSVTPPTGWIVLDNYTFSTFRISTCYKVKTQADSDLYSFTIAGSPAVRIWAFSVSGANVDNPIFNTSVTTTASSSTLTAPASPLTTAQNSLPVLFIARGGSGLLNTYTTDYELLMEFLETWGFQRPMYDDNISVQLTATFSAARPQTGYWVIFQK
jgi:hypothetical protein